jgi:S1-C subfamily serine protease
MKRLLGLLLLVSLACLGGSLSLSFLNAPSAGLIQARGADSAPTPQLRTIEDHLKAIIDWSGTPVVFDSKDLPPGKYHDIMTVLGDDEKLEAARLALQEFRKYPRGYLGKIGIKGIGIFKACGSRQSDGFHAYDEKLKGYRYYGIWNGKNGIAAAFYSDGQLPLTLHHEVFHHVDATRDGKTDYEANFLHDDRIKDIQAGKAVYPKAPISEEDLAALKKIAHGNVLEGAVSEYAKKSSGEDKAETARWFMTHLPDALIQVATRPELPGSQRMLHLLSKYEHSIENGPGLPWFVDTALGRGSDGPTKQRSVPQQARDADSILARLHKLATDEAAARTLRTAPDEARETLAQAAKLSQLKDDQAARLLQDASTVTYQLLRARIQPTAQDRSFTVNGGEDRSGANETLRADIARVSQDALQLKTIAGVTSQDSSDVLVLAQLRSLRLLARYQTFIASKWTISRGTQDAFEKARDEIVSTLPADRAALVRWLRTLSWKELAERVSTEGTLTVPEKAPPQEKGAAREIDNPYLARVDEAITDPAVRAAIRQVQPACLRVDHGSAVCVSADGYAITCAHVAHAKDNRLTAVFPDGRRFTAVCVGLDKHLDLALLKLETNGTVPFAALAQEPPVAGTRVVCIGQPGSTTPSGQATNYKPFHVSAGQIRGFLDDPLGDQTLGRTKHDAWTYWGHSGSPIFNEAGQIVALHNSWDSKTAMRHAVTYQAIVSFLKSEKLDFTVGAR